MTVLLAIGTEKGLFLATAVDDRKSWEVSGPHYPMTGVYSVAIDKRGDRPRLLAGMAASHWGPSLVTSDDLGQSWHEPDHAPLAFPERTEKALERVWQIAPGPADQPERVYAGTQPSALFVSDDGGRTYDFVDGLWDHPHRPNWGAGFGGQAVHTVLPDPRDPAAVLVAMSTGGVYRTADGGATWAASNSGINVSFLPDPFPEYAQRVHKVGRDAANPDRPYCQVHHGVYPSDDADPTGVYFGTRNGVVFASRDEGDSWSQVTANLPDVLCVRAATV